MNLTIGKKESGAVFHWPGGLEAVTQTFAILAKKGYGKSYVASVECEEMLKAALQVVVIDPTGAWFGLQSSADGKSEGFPIVVFGGDHGNIPLEELAGEIVARAVVEQGFSCILDLSLLRKGPANKFIGLFLETLYRLNRTPLHLYIDEADTFAPQRPFGEEARTLGATEDIVKKGRRRGIGTTLITQRPQTLNKNVLSQVDVLIAGHLAHPKDIDAIMEWVNVHATKEEARAMTESLPTLRKEEKWIWSPSWGDIFERIVVRKRETFDSGATPKPGEKISQPKKLAPIDIEALGKTIAETVERKKADDPKLLKAKVAELEKKLAAKVTSAPQPVTEKKTIEIPVLKDGQLKRVESILEKIQKLAEQLGAPISEIAGAMRKVNTPAPKFIQQKPPIPVPQRQSVQKAPAVQKVYTDGEELKITPTQQRILDALAWYESIGNMQPSAIQVGAIALIDSSGGYFSNTVGPLSTYGLVVRGPGSLSLTDEGRKLANIPDSVSSLEEYHEVLRKRVRSARSANGKSVEMLNAIIERGGEPMTSEEIGQAVGIDHTGGYFSNTIGPLSTLGFIKRERGLITPTDIIFPSGLS